MSVHNQTQQDSVTVNNEILNGDYLLFVVFFPCAPDSLFFVFSIRLF